MDKWFEYYVSETNKKFDEMKQEFEKVNFKLDNLMSDKISRDSSVKSYAFLWSTIYGIGTFLCTVLTVYLMAKYK